MYGRISHLSISVFAQLFSFLSIYVREEFFEKETKKGMFLELM